MAQKKVTLDNDVHTEIKIQVAKKGGTIHDYVDGIIRDFLGLKKKKS